jgi:lipoate-protein ligase A
MVEKSVYKVPDGKLLKILLEKDESKNVIKNILITGDFFAYPEDSIEMLEHHLQDTPMEKTILFHKIKLFIKEFDVTLVGVNAESLTEAILRCRP